jgi:hypothetical protein
MASRSRWLNEQDERIGITVYQNLADVHEIARCCTFVPKFVSAAAPEMGLHGLFRQPKSFGVHPCDHEDFFALSILHNGGD